MQAMGMEAREATAWLENKARIRTSALNFIKVPGKKRKEILRFQDWEIERNCTA